MWWLLLGEMLLDGRAPGPGEIIHLPALAKTFRKLASEGKAGFYEGASSLTTSQNSEPRSSNPLFRFAGEVANSIVDTVQSLGGKLSLEDLAAHTSAFVDPISAKYRGVDVWEIPPAGQGIVALLALKILEGFELHKTPHNSAEHLHLLIEALRLGFADAEAHVADPEHHRAPVEGLLAESYTTMRRGLIDCSRAQVDVASGSPSSTSDTVYFCAVDGDGNGCSYINSNYMGFGSGVIPKGCGFTLQNRGANFSLEKGST